MSSTFRDLVEERQDTIKSVLDLGHIPAGMEGFPAIDMEQLKYIKKVIDQCDYYILIVAGRYGSIDADGVSFTEKEYQYAVETGKVVLAFVLEHPELLPADKIDLDPTTVDRLNAFRAHVMTGRIVRHWKDRDSLKYAVFTSLVAAFEELPGIGWIRANTAASEDLLNQINELRIQKDELENAYAKLRSEMTPMVNDVASLDSNFVVHYSYNRYYQGSSSKIASQVTMTWRTIFIAVGPELIRAQNPSVISKHLQNYMAEKDLAETAHPSIQTATENQIKIQLSALGLIKNFQAKNTGGGISEWIQLTELGKRVLYESMVIKKA